MEPAPLEAAPMEAAPMEAAPMEATHHEEHAHAEHVHHAEHAHAEAHAHHEHHEHEKPAMAPKPSMATKTHAAAAPAAAAPTTPEVVKHAAAPEETPSMYSQRLLDDQWQRQQQKTFTAWVNSHLRKRGHHVDNVQTDFSDGHMLLSLMEVVGATELPKPAKGKMRIHKVENVGKALKYINSRVQLVGIGPEEIVDQNLKMILGMLWTIILRFEIEAVSEQELSAKDALLLWAQRKTAPYKNVDVQNFHNSWKDGLAFCALIHRHRPDLIDYDSLRKDNPRENFRVALETADKYLDIPPMLDAEDMITCAKPDERSVMTYVVAYYKAFASYNKNEVAAKKINNVLQTTKEFDKQIQEYEEASSRLLEWIPIAVARLSQRPALNSVDDCRHKYEEYNKYKSEEFPTKFNEKGDLEAHYSTLQTKLRLSGRPPYVPKEGKLISDIAVAWKGLEAAEAANKEWVAAEIKRNLLCEAKAERFEHKAASHDSWTAGRAEALQSTDYSTTNLAGVQALKKQHDAFLSDFSAHEPRVAEIGTLADELDQLNYFRKDEVNQRYADIYQLWGELGQFAEQRTAALDEAERTQQRLDELRLQYAKQVAPLSNSLDEWIDNLSERVVATSVQDVTEEQAQLAAFKESLGAAKAEYDALEAIEKEMIGLGATSNPYTTHPWETVAAKWESLQAILPKREGQLAAEVVKQENDEALRLSWAKSAAATQQWISEQDGAIQAAVSSDKSQSMEEELALLKSIESTVAEGKHQFDALEEINQQIHDSLILDNQHSAVSIEEIRGLHQQLSTKIKQLQNEINNQILARDLKGLSEEQLKEYRESFQFFDKDHSKQLDLNEFRACLLSLGYNIANVAPTNQEEDVEFNRVMSRVDPDQSGTVSFDEFVAFMAEEHADAETAAQLLDAFKVIAADKPYVLADALRRDLSSELADYCISKMSPYAGGPEGALDYSSFSNSIYGK